MIIMSAKTQNKQRDAFIKDLRTYNGGVVMTDKELRTVYGIYIDKPDMTLKDIRSKAKEWEDDGDMVRLVPFANGFKAARRKWSNVLITPL